MKPKTLEDVAEEDRILEECKKQLQEKKQAAKKD
jgi:hypothetical protein